MFTLRPGIDEERREGGREIKQVFCVGFEVALGAQLRVPRKQRLGGGGGKAWAFGISRCKLSHTEWINNKVLLHVTGN